MQVAPSNDALVFRQGSSQARQSSSDADVSRYFSAPAGADFILRRLQVVHEFSAGRRRKAPTVTDTDHSGMVGVTCTFRLGEGFRDWNANGSH